MPRRVERRRQVTLPKMGAVAIVDQRAGKNSWLIRARSRGLPSSTKMSITVSLHRRWGLHLVRFEDVVTFSELTELGRLHSAIPAFAAADAIHLIEMDADLSGLQLSELDTLREHYAKLQRSLDLYLVRRSAWVCSTATVCGLVEYWLDGRHSRDGQKTEVLMASDVAGIFPLFSREEIEAVQAEREFIHLMRIGGQAASSARS